MKKFLFKYPKLEPAALILKIKCFWASTGKINKLSTKFPSLGSALIILKKIIPISSTGLMPGFSSFKILWLEALTN